MKSRKCPSMFCDNKPLFVSRSKDILLQINALPAEIESLIRFIPLIVKCYKPGLYDNFCSDILLIEYVLKVENIVEISKFDIQ